MQENANRFFSFPEEMLTKSQFLNKFPTVCNKTGDDLQELIEEIPYPTEELSLTSFSSNSSAIRKRKPLKNRDKAQNSEKDAIIIQQQISRESPLIQDKSQENASFREEDEVFSNLANFEALTPHRINQIVDWSKNHVTPGDSKNIFPQVLAPSIEFSHETSAYLSRLVVNTEENLTNLAHFPNNKENAAVSREKPQNNAVSANLLQKFEEKPLNLATFSEKSQETWLKAEIERLRCEIASKAGLLKKKDQETASLIARIKEIEEELSLLREKCCEGGNLEQLRGKSLENCRREAKNLRKELENKQRSVEELHEQLRESAVSREILEETVEKELEFLQKEVEKHKSLASAAKRRGNELENQLKQALDRREIAVTELERKLEALSQGFEEVCQENEQLRSEISAFSQESQTFKQRILENEQEIEKLRQDNAVFKQREELLFAEKGGNVEKTQVFEDLERELASWKQKHAEIAEKLREVEAQTQEKEASFGKFEEKSANLVLCEHKTQLDAFFRSIGLAKEEEDAADFESKSFEEMISMLSNVFSQLHEQFEALYNERDQLLEELMKKNCENAEKIEENCEKRAEPPENQGKSLENKEKLEENRGNSAEKLRLQVVLSEKVEEIAKLKEQNLRIRQELVQKTEMLEILEVRHKSADPEVLVRNSESFQVLKASFEETAAKLRDSLQEKQDFIEKNAEISQKFKEMSAKYRETAAQLEEIRRKYAEISKTCEEKSQETRDLREKLEKTTESYENQLFSLKTARESLQNAKNSLENAKISLENEKFSLENEKLSLEKELKSIRNEYNSLKTQQISLENAENHRMRQLSAENEELKALISAQGAKIEEFAEVLRENLEFQGISSSLREKNDGLSRENRRFSEEISNLREELSQKDKKNVSLFKENRSLQENLKKIEALSQNYKLEIEKKSKLFSQKSQENRALSQSLQETKKNLEETQQKLDEERERFANFCKKVQENDEELREIKQLFLEETEKLSRKAREAEVCREKTAEELRVSQENLRKSREKSEFLEKTLKELKERQKIASKCQESALSCLEMLSCEETVEVLGELLRKVVNSNEILANLWENSEIITFLKRLLRNMQSSSPSLENSRVCFSRKFN